MVFSHTRRRESRSCKVTPRLSDRDSRLRGNDGNRGAGFLHTLFRGNDGRGTGKTVRRAGIIRRSRDFFTNFFAAMSGNGERVNIGPAWRRSPGPDGLAPARATPASIENRTISIAYSETASHAPDRPRGESSGRPAKPPETALHLLPGPVHETPEMTANAFDERGSLVRYFVR